MLDTLENIVKLDFDGRQEKISLFDGRIQLSAVKEAFGLSTVKINGRIEPVNDKGFTMTRFPPQSTVQVTGQPTSGKGRAGVDVILTCLSIDVYHTPPPARTQLAAVSHDHISLSLLHAQQQSLPSCSACDSCCSWCTNE